MKGLEALDVIKDQLDALLPKGLTNGMKYNFRDIEKELKALEIIKKKGINLHMFKLCDNLEEYNKLRNTADPLTQEEYDLLNEVLL